MDLEALREHLLAKPGAAVDHPFGPEAMVFKVAGKMFALIAWEETPLRITLKGDPVENEALRREYEAIIPGYYMNKKWWNTISLDGSVADEMLVRMMDTSYDMVVAGLTKKAREAL